MSEAQRNDRYAGAALGQLAEALKHIEFTGMQDRQLHAETANAYATLALVEHVRELTGEVRALRENAQQALATPVRRRWWKRGDQS